MDKNKRKKKVLLCNINYIELSTRKIKMFRFSCPEGITPSSGLTGPNNTIYIYISIFDQIGQTHRLCQFFTRTIQLPNVSFDFGIEPF